jgi:hypothetical protein
MKTSRARRKAMAVGENQRENEEHEIEDLGQLLSELWDACERLARKRLLTETPSCWLPAGIGSSSEGSIFYGGARIHKEAKRRALRELNALSKKLSHDQDEE